MTHTLQRAVNIMLICAKSNQILFTWPGSTRCLVGFRTLYVLHLLFSSSAVTASTWSCETGNRHRRKDSACADFSDTHLWQCFVTVTK